MMVNFHDHGYLLSASAPGLIKNTTDPKDTTNALRSGHTYSIVDVREVYNHKLINIRNLWGGFEWDGAWNRRSTFWTNDIVDKIKPSLEEDDGTFWMSFEDFLSHFAALNVCKTKTAHEIRLKGKFIRVDDSVMSKWFYYTKVEKKTKVQLGMHQFDAKVDRVLPRRKYLDAAFSVMELDNEGTKIHTVQDFVNARDCEVEIVLEPGQYVIIPRTTGIDLKRNPADPSFPVSLMEKGLLSEVFEGSIEDIFYRFDTMISNSIDFAEFKDMFDTMGMPLTKEEYDSDIAGKFCSTSRGVTLKGFKEFWKAKVAEIGEEKVRNALNKLGYDQEFYSYNSRTFIFTAHSDEELELTVGDAVQTNIEESVQELILREKGHMKENKIAQLLMYPRENE